MLFEDNGNIDMTFLNLVGITDGNKNDVLSAKEGFLRGNMFKNEYVPYKNLTYINLVPKNEKEARLFNVMQYSFAVNDLNLYLDLHPDDLEMFELFKMMLKEEKKAKEEYVKNYNPLNLDEVKGSRYDWLSSWPWESMGGSMYV